MERAETAGLITKTKGAEWGLGSFFEPQMLTGRFDHAGSGFEPLPSWSVQPNRSKSGFSVLDTHTWRIAGGQPKTKKIEKPN